MCKDWLAEVRELTEEMRKKGYEPLGVSSNTQEELDQLKSELSLPFELKADRDTSLRSKLAQEGVVDIAVTIDEEHPKMNTGNHPHGVIQPAILVYNPGGSVAYRWAVTPSQDNNFGAVGRPSISSAWHQVASSQ